LDATPFAPSSSDFFLLPEGPGSDEECSAVLTISIELERRMVQEVGLLGPHVVIGKQWWLS